MDGDSSHRLTGFPGNPCKNCREFLGFDFSMILYPFLRDRTIDNFQICPANSWTEALSSTHELAWQIAQLFYSTVFAWEGKSS